MHFGAVVRSVLSASCGSDLRTASAGTEVPELRSRDTQRILGVNLEREFGVTIPECDLDRLITVRDVLQCVRLHRWAARVERRDAAAQPTRGVFALRRRPSTSALPLTTESPPRGREHRR